MRNTNIKVNDSGTISPIDPSKPSSYSTKPQANTEHDGHWFTHEKQRDAYWNSAYYCRCGYASSTRVGVDGHVKWELEKLKMRLEKETKS